jgi:hypothetical protein
MASKRAYLRSNVHYGSVKALLARAPFDKLNLFSKAQDVDLSP